MEHATVFRMEHNPLDEEVAARIRAALNVANMSMRAAASKAAIPLTTLDRKLKAGSSFTIPELHALAQVIGVPVSTFLPPVEDAA